MYTPFSVCTHSVGKDKSISSIKCRSYSYTYLSICIIRALLLLFFFSFCSCVTFKPTGASLSSPPPSSLPTYSHLPFHHPIRYSFSIRLSRSGSRSRPPSVHHINAIPSALFYFNRWFSDNVQESSCSFYDIGFYCF